MMDGVALTLFIQKTDNQHEEGGASMTPSFFNLLVRLRLHASGTPGGVHTPGQTIKLPTT